MPLRWGSPHASLFLACGSTSSTPTTTRVVLSRESASATPPPSITPLTNRPNLPVFFEEDWTDPRTGNITARALFPDMIVVPVYHKIRVTYLDVLAWLTRLHRNVVQHLGVAGAEWDLHLITTNAYKNLVKDL